MDIRMGLTVSGLFFFGMGIVLLIWWSVPIRMFFINPEFTSSHSFTGEIVTLILPPMLATASGALLYMFHNNPPGRDMWKTVAIFMLTAGLVSLVLQVAYPIYISTLSGFVLQIFPGAAMLFMGSILLIFQPFARRENWKYPQ